MISCRSIYSAAYYLALFAVVLLAGRRASAQFIGPAPNAAHLSSPTLIPATVDRVENMTLLPGDVFQVQVFDVPLFDYKVRIDDDGNVGLPIIGTIHLGGQKIIDAEAAIAEKLVNAGYIKDPQVVLQVLESPNHLATVTGEVKTPGPVPIYGEKRLLDVLSAAGGTTPISSPRITIYRRGTQEPFQVELPTDPVEGFRSNVIIYPGDNIVVSKVGVIYVLGAFHTQGAIPLKSTTPLTLIEAMSLAGGVNYEAATNKAYILRNTSDGRKEISFNVAAVLHHRAADMLLQNDDIVLIPSSNMKAALKGGAAGVASSLLAGIGYISVR